jgi:hypothetical protein
MKLAGVNHIVVAAEERGKLRRNSVEYMDEHERRLSLQTPAARRQDIANRDLAFVVADAAQATGAGRLRRTSIAPNAAGTIRRGSVSDQRRASIHPEGEAGVGGLDPHAQKWAERNRLRPVCVNVVQTLYREHGENKQLPAAVFDALPDRVKTAAAVAQGKKRKAGEAQQPRHQAPTLVTGLTKAQQPPDANTPTGKKRPRRASTGTDSAAEVSQLLAQQDAGGWNMADGAALQTLAQKYELRADSGACVRTPARLPH